jgi:hypothetical protein
MDEFWSMADTCHNNHNFLSSSHRTFVDDVKGRPGWSSFLSRKKRPSVMYTHNGVKYRFRKISNTLFEWNDHNGNFCVSVHHSANNEVNEQPRVSIRFSDYSGIAIVSSDHAGRTDFIERLVILLSNTSMDDAGFSILDSLRYNEVVVFDNIAIPVFNWLKSRPVDDMMATAFAFSLMFNSSIIYKMGLMRGYKRDYTSEWFMCQTQEIESLYDLVSTSFNSGADSGVASGESFGCTPRSSLSSLLSSRSSAPKEFLDLSRVMMLCVTGMYGTIGRSSKLPFTDSYFTSTDGILQSIQQVHKVVKKQALEQGNSFEMDPMSYTSLTFFVRSMSKDYSFIKRMDEDLLSEFFIRFVELKNNSSVSTTDDVVLITALYSMLDNSPKYFGNLVTETLTKRVFDKILTSTDVNTLDELDKNALMHIKFDDLKWTLSLLFYQEMHVSIAFAYEIVKQMDCSYTINLQRIIGSFLTDLVIYQHDAQQMTAASQL